MAGFDGERGERDSRYFGPSGVAIPSNLMDAFVVMRFAEMLERGSLAAILENAVSQPDNVNFGGMAILRQVDKICEGLELAQSDTVPAAYKGEPSES